MVCSCLAGAELDGVGQASCIHFNALSFTTFSTENIACVPHIVSHLFFVVQAKGICKFYPHTSVDYLSIIDIYIIFADRSA